MLVQRAAHIRWRLASLCPAAVLTVACEQGPAGNQGGTPTASAPIASDELLLASASVALPPAGVVPAELPAPESGGAIALQHFCTACHALPSPAMHSATDWPSVVRRMWLRMERLDRRFAVPVPEVGDRIVLLDYLTGNALKVSEATLPDAPGRDAFEKSCSQCHELPDPKQHSPADWFVVVQRMRGHIEDILAGDLASAEVQQIVLYLERASAQ
jgi:cytochrome c5